MEPFCFQCQSDIKGVEITYAINVGGREADKQSFCGFECLSDFIEEMRSDTDAGQRIASMRLAELGEEVP
jgi:hypothetical protein